MSSLSILWNKERKQQEKKTYENRKQEVTNVKGTISSASDDNVSDINNKIDDCGTQLSSGITGIAEVGTLVTAMNGKKEKSGTSDGHLSSYDGELASEIADCETKISNLETEISSLETQYQAALDEEKKALEEIKNVIFG